MPVILILFSDHFVLIDGKICIIDAGFSLRHEIEGRAQCGIETEHVVLVVVDAKLQRHATVVLVHVVKKQHSVGTEKQSGYEA